MGVPEEIRAVERPKNTVVLNTGRVGPKQYPVRERNGVTYIHHGNPQPINGKVIGHIVGNKFVPIKQRPAIDGPDSLSFGSSALVFSVIGDVEDDLYAEMDVRDAQTLLAAAMLRIIKPGIVLHRYSTYYNLTYVRSYYPGLGLSASSIEDLEKRLGEDDQLRSRIFERRFNRVLKHHKVVIDGTLKQDTSTVNSLSAYSYKARIKGCRDISVLYAYDVDTQEPICSQVFPGNSIDAVSYREFIKTNNITKGLILTDKGFPPSKIEKELKENKDLHYLSPIKLNDKRIAKYKMLDPEEIVKGIGKAITCKKQALPNGKFLYSFRDVGLAGSQDVHYIERASKNGSYDICDYQKVKDRFGIIVFESDQDLDPADVYRCYDSRWEIELVFKYYKSDVSLDKTGAQADFEVIGSEFINFIVTILTCRIIRKMSQCGVLDKLSYKMVMDDLFTAFRKTGHGKDAVEKDEYWVHTLPKAMEVMVALGLAKPIIVDEESQRKADEQKPKQTSKNDDKVTTKREQRDKRNKDVTVLSDKNQKPSSTKNTKSTTDGASPKRRYIGPADPDFVGPRQRRGRKPKQRNNVETV